MTTRGAMNTNGFQRLVLLGSAGYQRAELPLDDSVSLIAPNNTGKTSLINALQFLLIIHRNQMDFGAHEFAKTRRFYFPNNSAYILLEVSLPKTGTVVLGCVGKGVSHDYEYFAYQGPLQIKDYRRDDGSLVNQTQLGDHLAGRGRSLFTYNPTEFAEVIYGGRNKRQPGEPDFTVFRLENANDARAYRQVLTRTLRLDKLTSSDVKKYLLGIFKRDLPDANIDFKQEWDKAFSEVNADRAQLAAAQAQLQTIAQLEQDQQQRLVLRGKIIDWKPRIDHALHAWQAYFEQQHSEATAEENQLQDQQKQILQHERKREADRQNLLREQEQLAQSNQRQKQLAHQLALVSDRSQLESLYQEANKAFEAQVARVSQAGSKSVSALRRDLQQAQREQDTTRQALATLSDNLYRQLAAQLNEGELEQLNRSLNSSVMTLGPAAFELQTDAVQQWLRNSEAEHLALPGLTLNLTGLKPGFSQRSEAELRERLDELAQHTQSLQQDIEVAQALDAAKQKKAELDTARKAREQDLTDFDELTQLQATATERQARLDECEVARAAIEEEQAQSESHAEQLREQLEAVRNRRRRLENQHQTISKLRTQRSDTAEEFAYLDQQQYLPWLGEAEWPLDALADRLQTYQADCNKLQELHTRLHQRLMELHSAGLTKYQYSDDAETEIQRIIDFSHQLDKEAEALEKKARSAVVNVTASLRELRDGLRTFKSRMNEFNRLIGRRQLSDLKVFKIIPEDEAHLVEAVELLIATAEKVNSGDTFNLFNQTHILDDAQLDRARQTLINEGNARQGLKVSDLFRLMFVVGKVDAEPESFAEIDSAASNGTVLMAKLVTGLAMLHLMQDKSPNNVIRTLCYLDEALALDAHNQTSLIDTAADFGFALVFASPTPLITARYCVPIHHHGGKNHISRQDWQILEPIAQAEP